MRRIVKLSSTQRVVGPEDFEVTSAMQKVSVNPTCDVDPTSNRVPEEADED